MRTCLKSIAFDIVAVAVSSWFYIINDIIFLCLERWVEASFEEGGRRNGDGTYGDSKIRSVERPLLRLSICLSDRLID